MPLVEAEGRTLEEAIRNGCAELGLEEKDVDIEILQEPKSLLGVTTRKAMVRLTAKSVAAQAVVGAAFSRDFGGAASSRDVVGAASCREEDEEADTHEGEDRDEDFDPASALETICRAIAPDARVDARQEPDRLVMNITCGGSGIFIGRHGQTLDALQYLINRMTSRMASGVGRIVVDSEDYRARRVARIEDDAKIMASRVKSNGRPVSSEPMTAFDRRIFYTTLRDDEEVDTRSLGEGELKRVQVFLRSS